MKKRLTTPPERLWYLLVFGFFLIWFTQIHPLTVFDGDDWYYISYSRRAIPIWGNWNPSRVLPEILMPFCSSIAAYVVYPLIGNYLRAMTLTHGFVVALFLTLYTGCFFRMMKRLFHQTSSLAILSSALFLIAHFLALRGKSSTSTYLFYCDDLTCYYYYLIPAVINSCLVMWLLGNPKPYEFLKSGSPLRKGVFFLLLYLAIFSNLPDSGILAVYAGSIFLLNLIKSLKSKPGWQPLLRENALSLSILGVWLVSAVFELSGRRAHSDLVANISFPLSLKETILGLFQLLSSCNRIFIAICGLIVIAAAVLLIRAHCAAPEDQQLLSMLPVCLIAIIAAAVYTVLLCAAVDHSYIQRSEYLFGLFFYCMLLVMLSFGCLAQKRPQALYAAPILLCILFFGCDMRGTTYLDSTLTNLNPAICSDITQDMIDQLLFAQDAGLDEVTLEVPVFMSGEERSQAEAGLLDPSVDSCNWPLPTNCLGERMVYSLRKHNVLKRTLSVTIVPSAEQNIKYNIPLPE